MTSIEQVEDEDEVFVGKEVTQKERNRIARVQKRLEKNNRKTILIATEEEDPEEFLAESEEPKLNEQLLKDAEDILRKQEELLAPSSNNVDTPKESVLSLIPERITDNYDLDSISNKWSNKMSSLQSSTQQSAQKQEFDLFIEEKMKKLEQVKTERQQLITKQKEQSKEDKENIPLNYTSGLNLSQLPVKSVQLKKPLLTSNLKAPSTKHSFFQKHSRTQIQTIL